MAAKVAVQVSMLCARRMGLAFVVVLLLACTPLESTSTLEDEQTTVLMPAEMTTAVDERATEKENSIAAMLAEARRAMSEDRLMMPKQGSAYYWYQQVLTIEGSHPEAHQGMREMGAQYLRLAEQAYKLNRRARAELLLGRAMKISASLADVEAMKARYPERIKPNNEFHLAVKDLSRKNSQTIAQLRLLAEKARQLPSRLLIIARSDAEGRWIYKQMRQSVEGYRLRGNIKVGRVPKVVLIDMADTVVELMPAPASEQIVL